VIRDLIRYRVFRRHRSLLRQSTDFLKIGQVLGLRDVIQRLFADAPFYGDRLRRAGNRPGDLRTVKDLAGMPATAAEALAEWLRAGDPRAAWGARTADSHEAREIAAGVAWASMPGSASAGRAGAPGDRSAGAGEIGGAAAAGEASRGARDAVRGTARDAFSLDAAGRVIALPPGIAGDARLLHLFALLSAWGVGPRTAFQIACSEDFGQRADGRGFLFRAPRAAMVEASVDSSCLIEPGQLPGAVALDARGAVARDRASRWILRGAPVPADILDALGLAADRAPRAILGTALFGPIAWQCAAGSVHPLGARAVIEPATDESVARGLTGGSRASRAPRTAGALHLTLLEESRFPIFRADLGLRGRFVAANCSCGARSDRIEMEVPFLGPLRVAAGAFIDPLPIARAAAAVPGVRRVALIQEAEERIRLLAATDGRLAAAAVLAAEAALAAIPAPPGVEIVAEVGAERDLAFPDRGFIRGLAHGPLLAIGAIGD